MLELLYATKEEIPEGYDALYTEQGGKWVLTGVKGIKSQSDIDKLTAALAKEKGDHKVVKDLLKKFGDADPEKVANLQVQVDELTNRLAGTTQEEGSAKTELATTKTQLQDAIRKLDKVTKERDAAVEEAGEAKGSLKSNKVEVQLRAAASKLKVVDSAVDDVLLHAGSFIIDENGSVVTEAGVKPEDWLNDLKQTKQHWWPQTVGAGGKGGREGSDIPNNPWSKGSWNKTLQGQVRKDKGDVFALKLATQAGSTLGATKPPEK